MGTNWDQEFFSTKSPKQMRIKNFISISQLKEGQPVTPTQERIINKSVQLSIASVDTALSGMKC